MIIGIWHAASCLLAPLDRTLFHFAAQTLGDLPENKPFHLLQPGETPPRETGIQQESRQLICPPVGTISLSDDDVRTCFAALPLGPQDLAVMLNNLSSSGGIKALGLSAPLVWEESTPDIAQHMIRLALSGFNHAAIGLRGRTASQADFTPTVLRQYTIPAGQIEGDATGLPSANKALPNDLLYAAESMRLSWAPDWLEDEPLTQKAGSSPDRSYPLLVRWNGEIMPTLPLCLAMQAQGLGPSDITVRMGKEIRLGNRSFPLDEHGRTRLKDTHVVEIALTEVVSKSGASIRSLAPNGLALIEQPGAGQESPGRLHLMASTLSQLCAREKVEYHLLPGAEGYGLELTQALDGWIPQVAACLALLLYLRLIPLFPKILRRFVMLVLLGLLLWYTHLSIQSAHWFHLSAALLVWLALFPAIHSLTPVERSIFRSRHR